MRLGLVGLWSCVCLLVFLCVIVCLWIGRFVCGIVCLGVRACVREFASLRVCEFVSLATFRF